jgi:16S rRNA processing protein RimM
MDDLVAIAKVVRPRGLKGEVFAELLTDFPERFEGLEDVVVVLPDARRFDLKIEDHWFQNGRLVLRFAEYATIEAAETLRDGEVCIAETEAVELEDGEFFDWQLEGCRVETVAGETLGTVREVQRTGGTENLLVDGGEKDYLIPFAKSICIEVDIEKELIKIDPPEGLLEF